MHGGFIGHVVDGFGLEGQTMLSFTIDGDKVAFDPARW